MPFSSLFACLIICECNRRNGKERLAYHLSCIKPCSHSFLFKSISFKKPAYYATFLPAIEQMPPKKQQESLKPCRFIFHTLTGSSWGFYTIWTRRPSSRIFGPLARHPGEVHPDEWTAWSTLTRTVNTVQRAPTSRWTPPNPAQGAATWTVFISNERGQISQKRRDLRPISSIA